MVVGVTPVSDAVLGRPPVRPEPGAAETRPPVVAPRCEDPPGRAAEEPVGAAVAVAPGPPGCCEPTTCVPGLGNEESGSRVPQPASSTPTPTSASSGRTSET